MLHIFESYCNLILSEKTYSETYQMIMDGFEKEEKEGLHGWFSRNKGATTK